MAATCRECSGPVPDGSRFCPACGLKTDLSARDGAADREADPAASETPTVLESPRTAQRLRTDGASIPNARGILSSPAGAASFSPGEIVAERYRIIGLLGRGGMGEVYRADDIKLGTAVALKFLPKPVERDPAALDRFHSEVRTARQVSHPHVCRVYDIGEVGGRHFISMEYVDGEDLATLLRRIGRLPPAKALEIARQLCSGLAAAHDKGVLHRDLKPANVMLDGHGRARITDFGLAVIGEDVSSELAGTPAYMAPELLAGAPASVQSDIYALGLVLYEIFTGKRTFEARTLEEWKRVHLDSPPTSPSLHTLDMDPVVERVILRCLEKDPSERPRSAAQVAMALPGGDPLAAAIAAGETPSPEMVAAAGGEGGLTRRQAWTALLGLLAILAAIAVLSPYSTDLGLAPMKKSPDVLRDRAISIAARFGYGEGAVDETSWLSRDYDQVRWLADNLPSPGWRGRLASIGSPVLLHYRSAPELLESFDDSGEVTDSDPPMTGAGAVQVVIDAEGRLHDFYGVSPEWDDKVVPAAPIEDAAIFAETGLDPARFESVTPTWIPEMPFDDRREWTGTRAEVPELPLRLSIARFSRRIVSVATIGPWYRDVVPPSRASITYWIQQTTLSVFLLVMIGMAVFFARRNLLAGRGDRRGALRIGMATTIVSLIGWMLLVHPLADGSRFVLNQLMPSFARAIFDGAFTSLAYLALEPYVRRRTPELLVGWARLVDGRFRDARVGRDILVGLVLGGALSLSYHLVNGVPTWFPLSHQTTIPSFRASFGAGHLIPLGVPVEAILDGLLRSLSALGLLFLCRLFLPRRWMTVIILGVVFTLLALGGENSMIETPGAIVSGAIVAYCVTQWGLLSQVTLWIAFSLATGVPFRFGLAQWYAPYSIVVILLLAGLALWSFRTSLGNQSPFGELKVES